jgi:1,2-dihydroxy-3-keto-5-methylthiopentene dioxygenase
MAILNVPDDKVTLRGVKEIGEYLAPYGIWFERWHLQDRGLSEEAAQEEILEAYKPEIEKLKERGGYVTADVISVNAQTPGLDVMLAKFDKEHTHSEDEVRFVVQGAGIFHVNPLDGPVFSIEMEPGDLINVPAGTRHWFNLCASRSIRAIRLFKDASGWTPEYLDDAVHARYEPLCFAQTYSPANREMKSGVKIS